MLSLGLEKAQSPDETQPRSTAGSAAPLLTELFSLEEQVAVVTGGTGVLGGMMAQGLARAGAKVAVLGRRRQPAEALAQAIQAKDGTALALPSDVLERGQLEAAREV